MSEDGYLLARGYLPSTRLNLYFYLWREALGYILHPAIVEKKDWRVADVATGTGLWLCELAKNAPLSAHFDGFDISSDQFPHPSCLPKNVILHQLNAIGDPPDSLYGSYDVVHVRLLFAVIDGDDPTPVLKHCIKLLKPGGYLQWDELDPGALFALPRPEAAQITCLAELAKVWTDTKRTGWIPRLPEIFEQNGLEVEAVEAHTEREWQKHMMMEIWCLVADDYASVLDRTGPPGKGDEIRKLRSGAYKEIKQGSYFSHTIRVTVGRLAKYDS